jgi:hypothetical protein
MTLTEEPQKLLELRQFYLVQVEQFYQQIQAWGKDKLKFTPPEDYSIYDKTGDYQARKLTAEVLQKNPDGLEGVVDFLPQGIVFLTNESVIQAHGPFGEEELVYLQTEKLRYTIKNGQRQPRDEGFEGDGWYWMFNQSGKTKMRLLTENVFWEVVCKCTGYSPEKLP